MDSISFAIVGVFLIMIGLPFLLRGARSERVGSTSDPVVGKRDSGWFRIAAGLTATYAGGSALLNTPSLAYTYGWWALVDTASVAAALLFSALVVIPAVRGGAAVTLGTVLESDEPWRRISTGLLSCVVYTLLTGAQILALTRTISPYLPVSDTVIAGVGGLLVALYVGLYGYKAVTQTDVLQLLLLLVFFSSAVLFGVLTVKPSGQGPPIASQEMPLALAGLLALPLLFVPTSQDLHIRIQSARTRNDARNGALVAAGYYGVIGLAAVLAGRWVSASGIHLNSPDEALTTFIVETLGPIGILPTLAILAAVVSSLDSTLFAAAAAATYDVLGARSLDADRTRKIFRASVLGVLLAGTLIALQAPRILSLILSALIVYVAVLLPMLLGRRLGVRGKPALTIFGVALAVILVCEVNGLSSPYRAYLYAVGHIGMVLLAAAYERRNRTRPG